MVYRWEGKCRGLLERALLTSSSKYLPFFDTLFLDWGLWFTVAARLFMQSLNTLAQKFHFPSQNRLNQLNNFLKLMWFFIINLLSDPYDPSFFSKMILIGQVTNRETGPTMSYGSSHQGLIADITGGFHTLVSTVYTGPV